MPLAPTPAPSPLPSLADQPPLTLLEGVHWVLQQPGVLERNRWWNNRHTWLGFASTTQRTALPT